MHRHTHPLWKEARLLHFGLEEYEPVDPEPTTPDEGVAGSSEHELRHTEGQDDGEEKRPAVRKYATGIKNFDRFFLMEDDEYRNFLKGGDVDAILPETEGQRGIRVALEGFAEDVKNNLKGVTLENGGFTKALSVLGAAIDKYLVPLFKKYQGKKEQFAEDLSGFVMRKQVERDQELLGTDMEDTIRSPGTSLSFSMEKRQDSYDKILAKRLETESLQEISADVARDRQSPGMDALDAQGMERAIGRYKDRNRGIVKTLSDRLVGATLPEGMRLAFEVDEDGNYEVQFRVDEEHLEEYLQDPDTVFEMKGKGKLVIQGTGRDYVFVYNKQEGEYELQ